MAVDVLFKKALARVKDRYLNFLITTVLAWAIGLGIALLFGLGLGATFLTWILAKNPTAVGVVGAVMSLLFLAALVYFTSWAQLATVDSLIQTKKLSPFEIYKKVQPMVKDYVVFAISLLLFFFGLLPFTLLSVFIVGLLWALWSLFSIFVFLEKRKKGMENLWISREMVNQKFWPITGIVLLAILLSVIVSMIFMSSKNGFIGPLVSQLLITPFVMSLYYEMYKTLKVPASGKTPKIWMGLSVVGFIITILTATILTQTLMKAIPNLLQDKTFQEEFYKELQKSTLDDAS